MSAITPQITEIRQTADLVRAAQAGDRAAFGELFERFQPTILAIAMRRMRNASDAQELVQDVFIQAMTKIEQLRTPECFIGWLRQITVRMSINKSVRRAPSVAVEPEILEATITSDISPVDIALAGERKDQVRDGLSRLRDMDRETLNAFYVQGQSLIEMADQFSAPIGTIKRRLHTARKRLAKEVEEGGRVILIMLTTESTKRKRLLLFNSSLFSFGCLRNSETVESVLDSRRS